MIVRNLLRVAQSDTPTRLFHAARRQSVASAPAAAQQLQQDSASEAPVFKPKKVLVLSKLTRYEFERRRHPRLSETELAKTASSQHSCNRFGLADRGSDYQGLLYHHDVHTKVVSMVAETLRERGIEARVVQRFDYNSEAVDWADVVMTTGGDGTFLLAASRIQDSSKVIIGINSDPSRSEGYLCLPSEYSSDFPRAMEKLFQGHFRWNYRQRIRITLTGEQAYDAPVELHDQQLLYPEYRFMDCLQEQHRAASTKSAPLNGTGRKKVRILPVLALNEVFIGESLSSRVSYYEISMDGQRGVKQKSSGVTICTGTGSSSWHFNINKLTNQCVENLLTIVKSETGCKIGVTPELIQNITDKFNNSLYFDASELKMAYTIRDPVVNGTVYTSKPRGFANSIELKSRCFNACLVIDGGLSFMFNDGATALFEMYPDDALRTVTLLDD